MFERIAVSATLISRKREYIADLILTAFLKKKKIVSMAAIKNIIFDLGGVLLNIDYHKTANAFKALGQMILIPFIRRLGQMNYLRCLKPVIFRRMIFTKR